MLYLEIFSVIIFGLIIGSFANVLIYRIPRNLLIGATRSQCPSCGEKIRNIDLIPVLSWLLLKGECRHCGSKIHWRYATIEIVTAGLFLLSYFTNGFTVSSAFVSLSLALLLVLAWIDYEIKEVPDIINYFALAFAIIAPCNIIGVQVAFIDSMVVAGAFSITRLVWSSLKKEEAIGEGDIIVGATIGALAGASLAIIVVLISQLLAIVFFLAGQDRAREIPLVPFLLFALISVYYFKNQISAFLLT